jgi:hypothetical protein
MYGIQQVVTHDRRGKDDVTGRNRLVYGSMVDQHRL